jgi:hypothetical protein
MDEFRAAVAKSLLRRTSTESLTDEEDGTTQVRAPLPALAKNNSITQALLNDLWDQHDSTDGPKPPFTRQNDSLKTVPPLDDLIKLCGSNRLPYSPCR